MVRQGRRHRFCLHKSKHGLDGVPFFHLSNTTSMCPRFHTASRRSLPSPSASQHHTPQLSPVAARSAVQLRAWLLRHSYVRRLDEEVTWLVEHHTQMEMEISKVRKALGAG